MTEDPNDKNKNIGEIPETSKSSSIDARETVKKVLVGDRTYNEVEPFKTGAVEVRRGDQTSRVTPKRDYDFIEPFENGTIPARTGNSWFHITTDGQIVDEAVDSSK